MAEGLKAVESFNATGEPSIVAARWERWRKSFKFYIAALGTVTDARQKALLLHCGVRTFRTFSNCSIGLMTSRQTRRRTTRHWPSSIPTLLSIGTTHSSEMCSARWLNRTANRQHNSWQDFGNKQGILLVLWRQWNDSRSSHWEMWWQEAKDWTV